MMPASFENITKTNHVTLNICSRILDRISNTGLSSQIHYFCRLIFRKQRIDRTLIT